MTWSPTQYLKFEDERTRPARDLLAQVPLGDARRVVDIGCGPGNSTELLVERFPEAEVIGLDSSAEMLAAARKRLPAATFVEADAATWSPAEPVDLLFANAVFQWVPDHLAVLARLLAALAGGRRARRAGARQSRRAVASPRCARSRPPDRGARSSRRRSRATAFRRRPPTTIA